MSNATAELRVEMTDLIRQRPDLSQAADLATRYLSSQLDSHANVFGENRGLMWQYLPEHIDGPRVVVAYTEDDSLGHRHITRFLRPEELKDAVSRDVQMIHLLQDVLKQRWKQLDRAGEEHQLSVGSEG